MKSPEMNMDTPKTPENDRITYQGTDKIQFQCQGEDYTIVVRRFGSGSFECLFHGKDFIGMSPTSGTTSFKVFLEEKTGAPFHGLADDVLNAILNNNLLIYAPKQIFASENEIKIESGLEQK